MNLWFSSVSLITMSSFRLVIAGYYKRTVTYEEEILVKCFNLGTDQINSLMNTEGVDIWNVDYRGNVQFRISQYLFANIEIFFSNCKTIGNVENMLHRAERHMELQTHNQTHNEFHFAVEEDKWFKDYHNYTEIVDWWKKLSEDNPDEVTFIKSIGQSYEGRDMPAVVVTSSSGNPNTVYFQSLIHAREWISATTCMYFFNYLMENKEKDQVKNILNEVRFVIVPIVNPDGYEYTWTNDRLWRKNRRPGKTCSKCKADRKYCDGIDLNRNFEYSWGEGKESYRNPCYEGYQGPYSESEVETRNIVNFFRSLGNVVAALDWHSYGQMILRPFGWTEMDSPHEVRLKKIAEKMSVIIAVECMSYYSPLKGSHMYTMGGTALDWFYSDMGNINNTYRAASFLIELPDTEDYGFLLPDSEIIPVGKDWIAPILWLVENINKNPLLK